MPEDSSGFGKIFCPAKASDDSRRANFTPESFRFVHKNWVHVSIHHIDFPSVFHNCQPSARNIPNNTDLKPSRLYFANVFVCTTKAASIQTTAVAASRRTRDGVQ